MDDIPVPGMMDGRTYIFHVDANSAFLSWSASYRVNVLGEKRTLRPVPSIAGGPGEVPRHIGKLKQYCDHVIQYSIDEAWCVLEGFENLYGRGR